MWALSRKSGGSALELVPCGFGGGHLFEVSAMYRAFGEVDAVRF